MVRHRRVGGRYRTDSGSEPEHELMIGARGVTGLRHLLLGSVAQTFLKRCPVPVLVVRSGWSAQSIPQPPSLVRVSEPQRFFPLVACLAAVRAVGVGA